MTRTILKLKPSPQKKIEKPYCNIAFDPMETIDPVGGTELLVKVAETQTSKEFDVNCGDLPLAYAQEALELAKFNEA